MSNLFDPPQTFTLPLTKGRDLYCEFIYEPLVVDENGDPVLDSNGNPQYERAPYPDGSTMRLIIETADPVVSDEADIDGDTATILIDKAIVDTVVKTPPWRLEISYADGIDDVFANGKVKRFDGSGE